MEQQLEAEQDDRRATIQVLEADSERHMDRLLPPADAGAGGKNMTMAEALNMALAEEMAADPDLLVMGQDVGRLGVFFASPGASKKNLARNAWSTPPFANPA